MSDIDFTSRQIEIMEAATKRIDQFGIQELTIKTLAADVGVSEAALYRHFSSKNEILHGLLVYSVREMKVRIRQIIEKEDLTPAEKLQQIFNSQLTAFVEKPAIVSVIFSEGIFQFDKELSSTVFAMMKLMQNHLDGIFKSGQSVGSFRNNVNHSILTTIIMGSMRITVLKWKLSGHQSDLINDGNKVLNGLLKMIMVED